MFFHIALVLFPFSSLFLTIPSHHPSSPSLVTIIIIVSFLLSFFRAFLLAGNHPLTLPWPTHLSPSANFSFYFALFCFLFLPGVLDRGVETPRSFVVDKIQL
eukprot:TRINITY_DN2820_c0_g1_i1.p1 TRINITY_DN2820_c0_g1~~TRINITY_DN2820_c0_g1_i1.p1  ORF type:complete len:102 (-),score=6.78 TRINITY_DN2820_c0_g1_i1:217-522(-)